MIYWFCGQPGAGKTTIANLLVNHLKENGKQVFHIDGDDLREIIINKDYSKEGRYNNIRTAQNIALFLDKKGCDVVVSLVAPYLELREEFKNRANVKEFYVHTVNIRGREDYFSIDFEEPKKNFIDVDTTNKPIEESFKQIIEICKTL